MWIQRITVENWRGLNFTLDGLDPRLNLIAGPNESGKSRLVEALRFALFESTSGKATHKKSLESWGVAPEKPKVIVEFELNGTVWHLEKVFLGTGCNTRLRGGGDALSGEEAETRLSDLLGVAGGSGRTEVKVRDQGIWSLLWVDQGESQQEPAHNVDAQNHILGLLTAEIGEVAAGESGKRLLELAEAERNRFYTAKTGSLRDTLTKPRGTVQELERRLADAVARRDELARAADDLETTRRKVIDLQGRQREAQAQLAELTAQHQQTQSLRRDLDVAEERVKGARQSRDDAERRRDNLIREHEEVASLAETIRRSEQDLERARVNSDEAQTAFATANSAYEALQRQIEALEQRLRTLRRQEKLASQRIELERASKRLEDARKLVEQETVLHAELAGLPAITAADVRRLRQALDARGTARARLQGASVSLEITARRDLDVAGTHLAAGNAKQFTINDDRELELGDAATIHVRPGAGEILTLRDAAREAERQVAGILEELSVTDADEAESTARQRESLSQDLKRQQAAIAQQVPEGLPALQRTEAELRTAVETATADEPEAEPFDPGVLRAAEEELALKNQAAHQAQARRAALQEQLNNTRVACATVESSLEAERGQHGRLQHRVAGQPSVDDLRAQLEASERAFRERVAARDNVKERFEASGGDALAEDLQRATKAEAQLREQLSKHHETRIRLETTLESGSGDARHEQVLDLEAELTLARDALVRIERQAAAAKRLHEVLDREYRAARDRLIQPVIQRIRPYLDNLFPGSEVWLDEELALKGLRTEAGHERFEFLSGGAREQLSLLVRIGLAEVVGSAESWPLVLDDVLVNTDAERIRRMQRALFSAGRKMQILLFTCHGALFDALGPDTHIELPAPRARAPSGASTEP